MVLVRAGLQPRACLGFGEGSWSQNAVSIGGMLYEALRGSAYLMPWSRKKQWFSDNSDSHPSRGDHHLCFFGTEPSPGCGLVFLVLKLYEPCLVAAPACFLRKAVVNIEDQTEGFDHCSVHLVARVHLVASCRTTEVNMPFLPEAYLCLTLFPLFLYHLYFIYIALIYVLLVDSVFCFPNLALRSTRTLF